ncbi:hypothetical protein SRDD_07290 [Serratia sp. DD3]|nr:hypothetical protein SRDD_07290 [Serratia sp. DD3]
MNITAKQSPHRIAETESLACSIHIHRTVAGQRIIKVEQPGGGDIQVIARSLHIKLGSGVEAGEFIQGQTGITVDVDQAIEASHPGGVARQIDIAVVEPPSAAAGEGVGEYRWHITGKVQELQGAATGDIYRAIAQVLLQADGQLAIAINSKQPVEAAVITGQ